MRPGEAKLEAASRLALCHWASRFRAALSDPSSAPSPSKCLPQKEAGMMRGIYERGLLPKMYPNQSLFVVP